MQAQIGLPSSKALAALAAVVFAIIVLFATLIAVRTASAPIHTGAPAVHALTSAAQPVVQTAPAHDPDIQLPVCQRAGGPRC